GFGANSILAANAQEKEPMDTSTPSFWPDKARHDLSFQSPCNLKPELNWIAEPVVPFHPLTRNTPIYPFIPGRVRLIEEFIKYAQKQGPANILLWDSWVFG
ncbi:MAG TPA: hypothetical protein VMS23_03500, partial [Terrimicrobiaceae bacterium]|nr:hypothetical protein [Terrimicrobiaceae bacterium]